MLTNPTVRLLVTDDKLFEEVKKWTKRGSIAEAFKELKDAGLGKSWDKVSCICAELGRGKCDVACADYEKNTIARWGSLE